MKMKVNLKAIIVALIVTIIGIILIFSLKTNAAWVGIGGSLVASGLVIVLQTLFVDRIIINPLDEWGIEKIYATRAEKNKESDPELEKAKYCLDAIAFGLNSFRNKHTSKIETLLKKGINIRIITMNPESNFLAAREKEENDQEGHIKHTIRELITWADKLNKRNFKGKIIVKGYNCMTLDFYWRVDDSLYIGPYWYGSDSQQTITYKFIAKGKAFQQFTDYFESLWDDEKLCEILTEVKAFRKNNRSSRFAE